MNVRTGPTGESGSATIWVLAASALVAGVAFAAVVVATATLARHRVEATADLAALAGAGRIGVGGDPCQWAERVATANHAQLLACRANVDADGRTGAVSVSVTVPVSLVRVGLHSATAVSRAARLPGATAKVAQP